MSGARGEVQPPAAEADHLALVVHALAAQHAAHHVDRLADCSRRPHALVAQRAAAAPARPQHQLGPPAAQLVERGDGDRGQRRVQREWVLHERAQPQPRRAGWRRPSARSTGRGSTSHCRSGRRGSRALAEPHDAGPTGRRVHLQQRQIEIDAHGRRGRAAALLSPGPLRTADGPKGRPGGARSGIAVAGRRGGRQCEREQPYGINLPTARQMGNGRPAAGRPLAGGSSCGATTVLPCWRR